MVIVATGSISYRGGKKGGKEERMVKIVNLTPHAVTVMTKEGMITFEPSGTVARISTTAEPVGDLLTDHGSLPVVRIRCSGSPTGLPDPEPDTLYIVSRVVFDAVPDRCDLLVPDTGPDSAVRGADGQIIGVRRFICR